MQKEKDDATLKGRLSVAMAHGGVKDQAELAKKLSVKLGREVSRSTVNYWFRKAGAPPNIDGATIYALADILNVNARWLVLGAPHKITRPKYLSIGQTELIEIYDELKKNDDKDALEEWLSIGRRLVRLSGRTSAGNPFKAKV